MKRLYLLVEGQTEERFVNDVLFEHLVGYGVMMQATRVTTRLAGKLHRGALHKLAQGTS